MDALSKYAAIAVELLGLPPAESAREDMAILLGSEHGSRAADVDFFRTVPATGHCRDASPLLFTYTLPSIAIGEIAIRHRIMGPNACLMAGDESGLLALWEGARLVESGEAASCVCVGCDAIKPHAYAFLIERNATRALCDVERADSGAADVEGRDAPARLCGFLVEGREDMLCLPAPTSLGIRQVLNVRRSHGRAG